MVEVERPNSNEMKVQDLETKVFLMDAGQLCNEQLLGELVGIWHWNFKLQRWSSFGIRRFSPCPVNTRRLKWIRSKGHCVKGKE